MNAQQLKNSILQMAVQGKLVPQDPNDEPASVLVERIRKENERLIKEGKIKKEKLSPDDAFFACAQDETHTAVMTRLNGESKKIGVFSLRSQKAEVKIDIPDGTYQNLIDGSEIRVTDGTISTDGNPIIFTA